MGALTKGDDDEGPCPKCKATVNLDDLTPIGGGGGTGGGGSTGGGDGETGTYVRTIPPKLARECGRCMACPLCLWLAFVLVRLLCLLDAPSSHGYAQQR